MKTGGKKLILGMSLVGLLAASVRADDLDAKAIAIIDKAQAYLKSQQQTDGGWQKSDREPPAITALAVRSFLRDERYNAQTDFVAKGLTKLLSYQNADGGIYKDLLANYNTAIAIATLVDAKDPALKPRIEQATNYLKTLQWTEETKPEFVNEKEANTGKQVVHDTNDPFYGGWGYGGRSRGAGRPDLSNTQFAIEALKASGVSNDDPVMKNAMKFVTRCQNYSETNDQKWAGNDGGFVYGPSDDRQGESFAGSLNDTEGSRRLRSMGTMSYAGLKSMVYAGVSKDDPRVKAVWNWINNNFTLEENVGLAATGAEKSKNGLFYGYMAIGKALHAYGQPILKSADGKEIDWRKALVEKCAEIQNADGSFVGINKQMEDNPVLVTSYVLLALQDARADLKEHPAK